MIEVEGLPQIENWRRRMERAPGILLDLVKENFKTLGYRVMWVMRQEVGPGKPGYAFGHLWRSIGWWLIWGRNPELHVGTKIEHAKYIRYGTRPHWAPIGPLKVWAKFKLGSEKAAYAVQRSIARFGTSMYAKRVYGTKENPFDERTRESGHTRTAVEGFNERVGRDFVKEVTR